MANHGASHGSGPTGSGTANTVTKFTSSTAVGNSSITDSGTAVATSSTLNAGATTVSSLNVTGSSTSAGADIESGQINPTGLTGTNNDWAPANFATAKYIVISSVAATTISGMAGGVDGRIIVFIADPANGAGNGITLAHESASSSSVNRFTLTGAANGTLNATSLATAMFRYDGTAQRWRQIGFNSTTFGYAPSLNGGAVFSAPSVTWVSIVSATLGATQNNWGPTGASVYRITPNAGGTSLTGISSGVGSGRIMWFANVSTTDSLTLTHNDTGNSTAANCFLLPNSASLVIRPNGGAFFWYDATSSRWRCLGSAA